MTDKRTNEPVFASAVFTFFCASLFVRLGRLHDASHSVDRTSKEETGEAN